jgi:AcrR family transcriptional regulator
MARKPKSESETGAAISSSPAVRDRIIDATMDLAVDHPWDAFDIAEIAERAGVSLAEFRDAFPSKGAVLAGFSRRIDRIVLDGTGHDLDDEPIKDRLFDVMMRRFDALAPYREALRRITPGLARDPLALAAMNQVALNSMRFMLAAARIDTAGGLGAVRVQGAVLVYSRVMDVWLHDADPALSRTMARLDRELTNAGRTMGYIQDFARLAAPFRAIGERLICGAGRRSRDRVRRRERYADGYGDEAAAI